jgi:alanyl-tRNA synthetase
VTERIYYTEPARLEFDASVVAAGTADGRPTAVLDRTAFYPTSGGQPHDVGTLGGVDVLDVIEDDAGEIRHVLGAPLAAGTSVHGTIDAARRFDHTQQHTGQHILSAAFDRLLGARTVGFHLGAVLSTLDLDKVLSPESMARAESEANRVVWENRPVRVRFATAEEAARLPLRKDPVRSGPLRLIEVDDFDLSACGGTHVARTGEIGLIAVRSLEKFRGGVRLEFACGARALREFRTLRDAVAGSQTHLSVAPAELAAAIERLQGDNKDARRTIREFQERLAVHEAAAVVARAVVCGEARVAVNVLDGWDQSGLKAMASAAVGQPGMAVALVSAGEPAVVVIARAADVRLDAAAVLKALHAACGGKGGGKPDLAQGGGLNGGGAAVAERARQLIEQALRPAP